MWLYVIGAVVIYLVLDKLLRLPTVGKYDERFVFITGCDTGFGNLLAKRLDSLGFNVFAGCLTERGADELRKVSSARLNTVDIDVTSLGSIQRARERVEKVLPVGKGLWAIVNNAGVFGPLAASEFLSKEDYLKCLDVNLFGAIDVTRTFLPLVRREKGRVVNMSSIAGRIAMIFPPYDVSKYGIEAFSDCLRREILYQGVTVHLIEPEVFKTALLNYESEFRVAEKAFYNASKEVQEYYGEGYLQQLKMMMVMFRDMLASTNTSKVTDAYLNAITATFPRYRYVVGNCSLFYRVLWNLPEWVSDRMLTVCLPQAEGARTSQPGSGNGSQQTHTSNTEPVKEPSWLPASGSTQRG